MAQKTQKLVLAQVSGAHGKPYRVKKAFNLLDYDINQELDKQEVKDIMQSGVVVEIGKLT